MRELRGRTGIQIHASPLQVQHSSLDTDVIAHSDEQNLTRRNSKKEQTMILVQIGTGIPSPHEGKSHSAKFSGGKQ